MTSGFVKKNDSIVMVFGTRTFDDYALLDEKLSWFTSQLEPFVLVTGEWRNPGYGTPNYIGADLLAERWVSKRLGRYMRFPPRWDEFPNSPTGRAQALVARTTEMVKYVSDQVNGHALGFWDGESPGSLHAIKEIKRYGVSHKVIRYKEL